MLITEYLNILDISADNEKEGLYTFIMDDMKKFARRRHNVFFSLSLLIPAVLFFSCKNNVSTMFQDYNSRFKHVEDEKPVPVPGDKDFNEKDMLLDEYNIWDNETLNLYAPDKNIISFKWTVLKYPDEEPVELVFKDKSYNSTSSHFVLIPSDSKLLGEYRLELCVTDNNNKVYKDTCALNINRHWP